MIYSVWDDNIWKSNIAPQSGTLILLTSAKLLTIDYRGYFLLAYPTASVCVCVTIARVSRVKHRHISRSPPEFRREWAFSSRCSLSNFLCTAVTAVACFYNVLFTNCEPKMLRNIPTYFDTSHLTDTYPTPTQRNDARTLHNLYNMQNQRKFYKAIEFRVY
jgi:hypothetical protein